MDVLSYILEEGLIMIPTLYFLGFIIKNTNKLENWLIPFILLGVSFLITPWLLGGYSADNIIQAILVTAGAVFSNEMINQVTHLKGGK